MKNIAKTGLLFIAAAAMLFAACERRPLEDYFIENTAILVTPGQLPIPWQGADHTTNNIEVAVAQDGLGAMPEVKWTLTSSDSWLLLSLDQNAANASNSMSGTGTATVYTFVAENPDNSVRETAVFLNGNSADIVVDVTQAANSYLANSTVTVTPDDLNLSWEGVDHTTDNITVTCKDKSGNPSPGKPWVLTSADSWLLLSLKPDGSDAKSSVSGTGTTTVYTVAAENPYSTARPTSVYLNYDSDNVVVDVTQEANLYLANSTVAVTPDDMELPWQGVDHTTDNLTVTCLDEDDNPSPDLPWMLSSADSWLLLSLDQDAANASSSVSGVGDATVYTFATENPSKITDRATIVYLNGDTDNIAATVTQLANDEATSVVVTPDELEIPWMGSDHTEDMLTVTCTKNVDDPAPDLAWTLHSADSWLLLSLNPNGSGASSAVSGTGTMTVYTIVAENTSLEDRTTYVYLNDNSDYRLVEVTQISYSLPVPDPDALDGITGGGILPNNVKTYVGAFWRAGQTGERVIKINMGTTPSNLGAWSAEVAWYDSRWDPVNGDGIVLAAGESEDYGIYTDTPGDAENFQIGGKTTKVTGTVAAGEDIIFRIGLRSAYTPTSEYPARYAVVVLTYGNSPKKQKLFLRQGEGADYLMRKGDPSPSGAAVGNRDHVAKYSPYNLTAEEFLTPATATGVEVAAHGGRFTTYPTQAGAFWSFSPKSANNVASGTTPYIYAMSPTELGSAAEESPKGWIIYSDATYWGKNSTLNDYKTQTLASIYETCPAGYRRPTDGSATNTAAVKFADITAGNSEMGQSLWLNPRDGHGDISGADLNAVWGYYADGFFDRRTITHQPAYYNPQFYTAVDINKSTVAYIGQLFYNPTTSASLFFPVCGERDSRLLYRTGYHATYWSSGAAYADQGNVMSLSQSTSGRWSWVRYCGLSIRCVKDE